MPYVVNPFTGQLDYVNPPPSGGATSYTPSNPAEWSPVPSTVGGALDQLATRTARYSATFNATSDWAVDGSDYKVYKGYVTHGRGPTPVVEVFQDIGGGLFQKANVDIQIDTSGNVSVYVSGTPDLRFAGKIIIG